MKLQIDRLAKLLDSDLSDVGQVSGQEKPLFFISAKTCGILAQSLRRELAALECVGTVFFNRVVKAQLMKQESDEALVKKALSEDAPGIFDYLESQVRDGEWLVGSGFSIADIAVASPFVNLQHAGEGVDAGRWPKLAAYVERVHGRPSMKGLIEQEKAQFGSA